jgi:hypothetical protein
MAGGYRNHHVEPKSRNSVRPRIYFVLLLMLGVSPRVSASDKSIQAFPRIRGGTPAISQTISLAAERSPTFQSLVTTIEGTDGIVYVHRGQCGRQVLSCLLLAITKTGDYRMLHIKIDERRKGHDLMVSMAHELRHAIELLTDPTVVNGTTAQNFYHRGAPPESYRFETDAAIETELRVDKELREWAKKH